MVGYLLFNVLARSIYMFYAHTGMNTASIPVYNTEVSRPKYRGRDLAFGQAMLVAGIAISYWIGTCTHYTTGDGEITLHVDYGISFVSNSDVNWVIQINSYLTFLYSPTFTSSASQ